MTLIEAVRDEAAKMGKVAPTDKEAESIIWEKTGYPGFWNIPRDGATPQECFLKQVREALAGAPDVPSAAKPSP